MRYINSRFTYLLTYCKIYLKVKGQNQMPKAPRRYYNTYSDQVPAISDR